jgi:hypothetical protein
MLEIGVMFEAGMKVLIWSSNFQNYTFFVFIFSNLIFVRNFIFIIFKFLVCEKKVRESLVLKEKVIIFVYQF